MNPKNYFLPLSAFLALSSSIIAMDLSVVAIDTSAAAGVINACEVLYEQVEGINQTKNNLEAAISKARCVSCRAKDNPEAAVLDDKLKWLWHENDGQYSISALEHSLQEVPDKFKNAPVVANVSIDSVLEATKVLRLRIEKFNQKKAILLKALHTALDALKDIFQAAPLKERLLWLLGLIENNDELNCLNGYLRMVIGSHGELEDLAKEEPILKQYYEMYVVRKGLEKKYNLYVEKSENPE